MSIIGGRVRLVSVVDHRCGMIMTGGHMTVLLRPVVAARLSIADSRSRSTIGNRVMTTLEAIFCRSVVDLLLDTATAATAATKSIRAFFRLILAGPMRRTGTPHSVITRKPVTTRKGSLFGIVKGRTLHAVTGRIDIAVGHQLLLAEKLAGSAHPPALVSAQYAATASQPVLESTPGVHPGAEAP